MELKWKSYTRKKRTGRSIHLVFIKVKMNHGGRKRSIDYGGKKHVLYHDLFNIFFLSLISWHNIKFLMQVDISHYGTEALASNTQDRELFSFVHMLITIYFCSDLLYIWAVPQAVLTKQSTLILHHLLSLLFLFFPIFHPQFSFHCGCVIILEANALIMALRRNVAKDSLIYTLLDHMFLFTWITLRLIMLPAILVMFLMYDYFRVVSVTNTVLNFASLAIILQSTLVYMSYSWTYELLRKQNYSAILSQTSINTKNLQAVK